MSKTRKEERRLAKLSVVSCFIPPTDKQGRTLSYEEYCERNGAPFNDQQRATRQALCNWQEKNGHPCAKWKEYWALSKAIQAADDARFAELRAQGWEWPHRRKNA